MTIQERREPIHMRQDQLDPPLGLLWKSGAGTPIDMSTATFQLQVVDNRGTVRSTKTAGITGNNGANPDVANVVVTWNTGDISDLTPGTYAVHVIATISDRKRMFRPGNELRLVVEPTPS